MGNQTEMLKDAHEKERHVEVHHVGSLADLGIGNPDGIPSTLAGASQERLDNYGEQLKQSIDTITDTRHLSCIDGRFCTCNADGSDPEVRAQIVSGTGSFSEFALYAKAPFVDVIKQTSDDPVDNLVNGVNEFAEDVLGYLPSAHLGGCGGLLGAVKDGKAIRQNPAIMNATKAVMDHPVIKPFTKISYKPEAAEVVAARAEHTAEWLEENGWDGDKVVAKTKEQEPAGVEELETDHDEYHGHKEPAVVFFISRDGTTALSEKKMRELGIDIPFVVNVNTAVDIANALAGQRGEEGLLEAFTGIIAKHVAVCDRLPSPNTQVYVVVG